MDEYNCSFCGKDREEVEKIVAGPNVNICSECVDISAEILKEDREVVKKPVSEEEDRRLRVQIEAKNQTAYEKYLREKLKDEVRTRKLSEESWGMHAARNELWNKFSSISLICFSSVSILVLILSTIKL